MGRTQTATILSLLLLVPLMLGAGCIAGFKDGVLRLGYFPNLTHAQALYGVQTGYYQDHLNGTRLETTVFNAGPTAIEALLSQRIDVIYVGPSPTINGLAASGSNVLRIIGGAASGGAFFVVRPEVTLDDDADYANKKFASPQLGNTQDVALKHYLRQRGHTTSDRGGDVVVINAPNADILALFRQDQIDGAWLPEPWATRLVKEGGGRIHVNESALWPDGEFVTTHIVTSEPFLRFRSDDVRHLLLAHVNVTKKLAENDPADHKILNDAIEAITGKRLEDETVAAAMRSLELVYDPLRSTLEEQFRVSKDLGFVDSDAPDFDRVYHLQELNEALAQVGLPQLATASRGAKLRFRNITQQFQSRNGTTTAIKDLDLEVKAGEFVVVVGPSGCGKSTLLTLAAGLSTPTLGQVEADDKKIKRPDPSRILVFQQAALFPWLNVRHNVEFGLARQGVGRRERHEKSDHVLKMVQLKDFAHHRVHELSGGMQQRVALARALVLNPEVLLMDEPFAALDAQTREDLQDRVEALWLEEKPTVLFVTHDVREATRLADRIVVMSHRPGTIKSFVTIEGERPRDMYDRELDRAAREVRAQLAEEIAWVRQREEAAAR